MSKLKSQNNMLDIPVAYDDILRYNSIYSPIPVHTSNTYLVAYFYRYLLQRLFSVFDFKVPNNWDLDYFRYCLFCIGYVGVIDTKEFGIIPVFGQAGGKRNVYYRPTQLIVANPGLDNKDNRAYNIYQDCGFIKLSPDWRGVADLVMMYADEMAMIVQSFSVNIENSHVAYVFAAATKSAGEAFKKISDKINAGEPVVVYDKSLLREDGSPAWETFTQNLRENFIVPELIDALTSIENRFYTAVGIANANIDKKERLITDEVNANNQATEALCEIWLESIKMSIEKTKALFPDLQISVELKHPQIEQKQADSETSEKEDNNNG